MHSSLGCRGSPYLTRSHSWAQTAFKPNQERPADESDDELHCPRPQHVVENEVSKSQGNEDEGKEDYLVASPVKAEQQIKSRTELQTTLFAL